MRILIDECLDWRLCRSLTGHECSSVRKMGWDGLRNGELLAKAQSDFDVFVTGDRNLTFQQDVTKVDRPSLFFKQRASSWYIYCL